MYSLSEPYWWKKILLEMNNYVNANNYLKLIIPYTSDIFVFLYPIFLVIVYLVGVYNKKYQFTFRYWSLYVFFSVFISFLLTILIQQFISKQRPEEFINVKDKLLIPHVPDISFPSDHAVVSSSFAFACLFFWIKFKSKFFVFFGIVFLIISLIMTLSRVAAGIHWPTDILAWFLIGFLISLLIIIFWKFWEKYVFVYLIELQEFIFKIFRLSK